MRHIFGTLMAIIAVAVGFVGYLTSSTWYTGIFFFCVYTFFWPIVAAWWTARLLLIPFLRAHGLI